MTTNPITRIRRPCRRPPRAAGHAGRAAMLAAIALLAGACGLPYNSSPRALNGELPAALTNAPTTVTQTSVPQCTGETPSTTTPSQCERYAYVQLYYIQLGQLIQLPGQPVLKPLTITAVLQALQSGPSLSAAASVGGPVTTDLPVGSNLQDLGVVKGVAHIAADSSFYDQQSVQAELEFGQVVYALTATALGVTAVQFYFAGSVTSVVNASGQIVTTSVNQSDYCAETKAGCPAPVTSTTMAKT